MNLRETASILVVDDDPAMISILKRILTESGYRCVCAGDADAARVALGIEPFELVMSDVDMPGDSGLDLLTDVTRDHPDTATLMVTGLHDSALGHKAIELGAYGYTIKPFDQTEIIIDVANALRRRALEIENRQHRTRLEEMVKSRTVELWNALTELEASERLVRSSREETIRRLSLAAEFRDAATARHIERMSHYCWVLAELAGEPPERMELIRLASVMHDIGKIGVPDRVLLKPGKLTDDEFAIMKSHTTIGYEILKSSDSDLLEMGALIALTHHERIDGSGYPNGLPGSDIPIEGRIAAIADVFDALSTDRVYRPAFPLGRAVEMMMEGRGTHFDPDLLDLFLGSLDRIVDVAHLIGGPVPTR